MVDSKRLSAKLIVQAVDATFNAVPQFDVDLLEGGRSLGDRVTLNRQPGIVEVRGLFAGEAIEVVVSAPGFLTERRATVLAPADNPLYFTLGKRGMQFYEHGGMRVPYRRRRARFLVLQRGLEAATPRKISPALMKLIAHDERLTAEPFQESPAPRGKTVKDRRPRWRREMAAVDLIVEGGKADRQASIGAIAAHSARTRRTANSSC